MTLMSKVDDLIFVRTAEHTRWKHYLAVGMIEGNKYAAALQKAKGPVCGSCRRQKLYVVPKDMQVVDGQYW